ncbi:MAG: hypothetical protein K2G99_07995 [Desulfovibrio sp.]|nr:hypothetical protein [Desulfovibrio sp.]
MDTILTVDMSKKSGIRIGAAGLEGLEQEIRTVLATRKGSVPLDRDFGLSWDFIDKPLTEAMPYMVAEIGQQLERYVPRIRVRDIAFASPDAVEGILQPTVTVEIREEYLNDFA